MRIKTEKYGEEQKESLNHDAMARESEIKVIQNLCVNSTDGFVLAINGEWGIGKTWFLQKLQQELDNSGFASLYFNAWSTDFAEDPLGAISACFLKHLATLQSSKELDEIKKKFGGALRNLALASAFSLADLASEVIKTSTGGILDPSAIKKHWDQISSSEVEDLAAIFNKQEEAVTEFRKVLSETVELLVKANNSSKLIILVDELDRCRPTYAIELLERIKHFFATKNVVFIFGVNLNQLSHSVKAIYGNEFDGKAYLGRFFDFRFDLSNEISDNFLNSKFEELELEPIFATYKNLFPDGISQFEMTNTLLSLFMYYQMSLRTIEQFIIRLKVLMAQIGTSKKIDPVLLSFLLLIDYIESELLDDLCNGKSSVNSFLKRFGDHEIGQKLLKDNIGIYIFIGLCWIFEKGSQRTRFQKEIEEWLNFLSGLPGTLISRDYLATLSAKFVDDIYKYGFNAESGKDTVKKIRMTRAFQ